MAALPAAIRATARAALPLLILVVLVAATSVLYAGAPRVAPVTVAGSLGSDRASAGAALTVDLVGLDAAHALRFGAQRAELAPLRAGVSGVSGARVSAQAPSRATQAGRTASKRPAAAAAAPVPAGAAPRVVARSLLARYGWGAGQFGCLDALWQRESGWNPFARNPYSGAYGIPQALPASKMARAGADWRTNPATQIAWGLGYIRSTYGSPCAAWGHSRATGWY